MTIHFAYSTLQLKAAAGDGKKRKFTGIASTPMPDRDGDIMEPKGAEFTLPIPLLWQHDAKDPIGWITSAKVTAKGIEVEGELAQIEDDGTDAAKELQKRLDLAWQYLKNGIVRGLSIGFRGVETAFMEATRGIHFLKWLWLELSAVTIPANQQATITAIKSIDASLRASSGRNTQSGAGGDRTPPGVSGSKQGAASRGNQQPPQKGNAMKTLHEQLAELRTKRAELAARLKELAELSTKAAGGEGEGLKAEEQAEFDDLEASIVKLDADIVAKRAEIVDAGAARSVSGGSSAEGSGSRGGMGFVKKTDPDDKFKGQSYTRFLIAKALSYMAMREGQFVSAAEMAAHRWGKSHPNLVAYIKAASDPRFTQFKAAVQSGGATSGEWGAELAQSDARFMGDFVEFLYAKTVFDRLPLRSIPARVHVKGQDGAATGYWVGEGKGIPASAMDFSDVELLPLKVAALATSTKELIADSSPAAEGLIRDGIAEASGQRVDSTFLSTAAAVSGVSPAGLLNGLSAFTPSGTDAAAIRADYQTLTQPFRDAKNSSGLVHVMTPSLAMAIGMLVNALGQTEFPDITEEGGTLFKRPVFTGDNVTPGDWLVLKPSDIWKIGDSGIEVSMTDSATIESDSAPQGASLGLTAASASLTNLWQQDLIGFKVVRRINYAKRRSHAVQVLSNAEYGGVVS